MSKKIDNDINIEESFDTVNPEFFKKKDNLELNSNNKEKKSSRKYGLTLAIISVVFLIISLSSITFNVINIRLDELTKILGYISKAQEGNRSLHMLVRYFQVTQRLSSVGEEDEMNNNLSEVAMASVLPQVDFKKLEKKIEEDSLFDDITNAIIDGIRFMIGKSARSVNDSLLDNPRIQQAYIEERGRKWDSALDLYMNFMKEYKEALSPEEKAFLELHIAFCNAQKSLFSDAIVFLDGIIAADLVSDNMQTGKNDTQEVAVKLKNILEGLLEEQKKIKNEKDLLIKGISFYKIADYVHSIETLRNFKKNIDSDSFYSSSKELKRNALDEADYYIARALEELGKMDEAAKTYNKLIEKKSSFAARSMQRVVINKEVYKSNDKNLMKAFRSIEKKDKDFLQQVRQIARTEQDTQRGNKANNYSSMPKTSTPNILKNINKTITNVNTFSSNTGSKANVTKNIATQKQTSTAKIQQAKESGKNIGSASNQKVANTTPTPAPKPKITKPAPTPKTTAPKPAPVKREATKTKAPAPKPRPNPTPAPTPKPTAPKAAPTSLNKVSKITRMEKASEKIIRTEKMRVTEINMSTNGNNSNNINLTEVKSDIILGVTKSIGPSMKGVQSIDDPGTRILIPKRDAKDVIRDIPIDKIKNIKDSK